MSNRVYYREQILANCGILFPEPEKVTLLTVNESNKSRSSLLLLVRTQDMLALHAAEIRHGPSPEKIRLLEEEIAALRRENAELREENAELKCNRISVLERRVEELEKRLRASAGEGTRLGAFSFTPASSNGSM
ncbi:hypothetical protein BDD12DRAFT_897507 [Trichophaea hybrida]|nr:hypothetical protein BDD12DRAFT_897507 [Trichophaea hybrida]